MNKFKILCIFLILFLIIPNSSYALQQQNISKTKGSIIINKTNPIFEVTKGHNAKNIVLSDDSTAKEITAKEITVIDNVYKKNTISTSSTVTSVDLSMNSLTSEVQPFIVGQDANFQFKIANYSNNAAPNTRVAVSVDYTAAGVLNVGNINGGYQYTFAFSLNGVTEGEHQIILIAIPDNSVIDYNTSNDSISKILFGKGYQTLLLPH